jgi:hypothetical protein
MSKTGKTVLTVLIASAACIGAVVIIWTVIRKWKFSKSGSFDDRMNPIDWQPTTGEDDSGLPVRRRLSAASSFHSSGQHEIASQGAGAGYDNNNNTIPDHDFTAGPSQHIAPIGGYADLARGPSPPQMQEAYGYTSTAYGVNGAHDGYEYNSGPGMRY